jgi:hypothetical protein
VAVLMHTALLRADSAEPAVELSTLLLVSPYMDKRAAAPWKLYVLGLLSSAYWIAVVLLRMDHTFSDAACLG